MHIAVFIGGPADMTKRAVPDRRHQIYVFDRMGCPSLSIETPEDAMKLWHMECKKVRYELEHITRDGALIYSYAGYEPQ